MIYYSNETLKAFKDGRMIEIISKPDSGATSAILAFTEIFPDKLFVFVDFQNMVKSGIDKMLKKRNNVAVVLVKPGEDNHETLISVLRTVMESRSADCVIIDNFAHYILNKPVKVIKRLVNHLNGLSDIYGVKIVLINQMRYDINNIGPDGYAPLVPIYRQYIGPKTDTQLAVDRYDSKVMVSIQKKKNRDTDALGILNFGLDREEDWKEDWTNHEV